MRNVSALFKAHLNENGARMLAFLLISVSFSFDVRSILAKEDEKSHLNYDIASGVVPIAVILNAINRALDYRNKPEAQGQIKVLPLIILAQLSQMGSSIASASHAWKQPIALPVLCGVFSLVCFSYLNWRPLAPNQSAENYQLLRQNAGRIAGITCGMAGVGAASVSLYDDARTPFYLALTANACGGIFSSISRVNDIFSAENKSTLLNKMSAVLFFVFEIASALVSGLGSMKVWISPLDLAPALVRIQMLFFLMAQHRMPEQPAVQAQTADDKFSVISQELPTEHSFLIN